jgi:hydrogenase maturation protein HypF
MERRAIVVRGIVQGVGFRPFVHNLAVRLELRGHVRNQAGQVLIEVEGETSSLDRFLTELSRQPPALAQIEHLSWEPRSPNGDTDFRIEASDHDRSQTVFIAPDAATCAQCLAELFDPNNRRHGYPFLNCTHCGPRLTIVTGAPYDRPRTTMADFVMCPECLVEYDNPRDRRFHAQPTACAACGPQLRGLDGSGKPVTTADPLGWFAAILIAGKIGAMKGLGGYHLVCDAGNAAAVAELRRRKHRDEKPFAIMVPDIAVAEALCHVDHGERKLLRSPSCPIVLLRRRAAIPIVEAVAPGNPYLGLMLPYTPLHHLLLRAVDGKPLVMTSGNRSDEPIAYRDDDALQRLAGIADCFLVHNRPIHVRCDDSVTRMVAGEELPLRRSRGYAPRPIELPFACPCPILALGGQLKATFALGRETQAFVSHHLGELDDYEAFQAYRRDIELYQELFEARPSVLVHDLHPDYASTVHARERSAAGVQLLTVQHHHAHMASCMAEHRLSGTVIGVSLDGTGLGTDGAVWGGEFLIGDYRQFRRVAHLRYMGMPGGDQAIREPWRMGVAYLKDAGLEFPPLAARISPHAMATIRRMLERGINSPPTSSAGRLFDAVAALTGVRDRVSYEGQAAIELEWLATETAPDGTYPFELESTAGPEAHIIDCRPLIRAVVNDVTAKVEARVIARRFHTAMVDLIKTVCSRIREDTNCGTVVLSGGVFQNALLATETIARLSAAEFRVYRHRLVPPNDGGLSLGQLAVAAATLT